MTIQGGLFARKYTKMFISCAGHFACRLPSSFVLVLEAFVSGRPPWSVPPCR